MFSTMGRVSGFEPSLTKSNLTMCSNVLEISVKCISSDLELADLSLVSRQSIEILFATGGERAVSSDEESLRFLSQAGVTDDFYLGTTLQIRLQRARSQ